MDKGRCPKTWDLNGFELSCRAYIFDISSTTLTYASVSESACFGLNKMVVQKKSIAPRAGVAAGVIWLCWFLSAL
jgi:hypothetical protein